MNLALYLRVLWRFKFLLAIGAIVAAALAVFAYAKPSLAGGTPHFTARTATVYSAQGRIFVTQPGFPIGRSTLNDLVPVQGESGPKAQLQPRFSDPSRFVQLAGLYAELFDTDQILSRIPPVQGGGSVDAQPLITPTGAFPIILFTSRSTSPRAAAELVVRGMTALRSYVRTQQVANGVPKENQALLAVISYPHGAAVVSKPSLVVPGAVFVLVLSGFLALAFVLENLRPRVRLVGSADQSREQRLSA